jgi:hypothetical protein
MRRNIILLLFLFLIAGFASSAYAEEPMRKSITLFWGQNTDSDFLMILTMRIGKWSPYYIAGAGVNLELFNVNQSNAKRLFSFEWGNRLVIHRENHKTIGEGDSFLTIRYHHFPWSSYVLTTVAFGEGVSAATNPLPSEKFTDDRVHRNVLNYMLFEMTLGLASIPDWQIAFGIHHRSGIYGLYGVDGGSNYLYAGITKWF